MENSGRRKFIQNALVASVAIGAGGTILDSGNYASAHGVANRNNSTADLQFSQIKLPYIFNALEPHIDALTIEIHYTKHHAAYIKNVNEAIVADKLDFTSEKDFFDHASSLSAKARNNGGGAWNHNFFWQIMRPGSNNQPEGKLKDALAAAFGSVDQFKDNFSKEAIGRFGSGWAWLVKDDSGVLKIGSTPNQDNPLMDNVDFKGTPLLAVDVWEHAYYLKYQNRRNDYVAGWWNVVNWEEVAKRLG